ncbi:MAG: hypothetical protein Q8909_14790 [Bacteroidota bacterium]|nr:hypothetical protein [Bacteroidota bacterium]
MKFSSIIFLFIFSIGLFAQSNDSTYLKYLLHNSNVAKRTYYPGDSKNEIKTDIISIADGHLPIIWEHRFNNHLGVDAGPGILLPYTFFDILGKGSGEAYPNFFPFVTNPNFENKKLGVSFRVEPKIYYKTEHQITALSHFNSISTFYSCKAYSKLFINEVGLAYTYIADTDKFAIQPTFAFSYISQIPFNDVSDVKYMGKQSDDLSGYGLPKVSCFRLYLRFQVGYILEHPVKSNQ